MRITSRYPNNTAPSLVARWEGHANGAKTDEAAQVQLTLLGRADTETSVGEARGDLLPHRPVGTVMFRNPGPDLTTQ